MISADIQRTYSSPVRVLWFTEAVEKAELLLQAGEGQPTIRPHTGCRMDGRKGTASLLLDFGRELFGGLQFVTNETREDKKTAKVRVRLGESVSEAMGEPTNEHGINDDVVSLPMVGLAEFGKTGFRFARLDLLDDQACLELREVRAIVYLRPLPMLGSFECSDERLTEIWNVGARTVHLNMQEYLWDGIKRDRLIWMGDMHPEACVISTVFGEVDIVPRSLDRMRDEAPLPDFMNDINSYSMWWILTHRDWYQYHGNLAYLQEQKDYLLELLKMLEDFVDETGREKMPEWRFIDWLTAGDSSAIDVGMQSLLTMTFQAASDLLRALDLPSQSEHYAKLCRKMRRCDVSMSMNKPVNALRILSGCADATEVNQAVLAKNPLEGLSPFYGYYVLQARAKAGDYPGCFELLRRYWGGMLDLGASTFWEHFDIRWMKNAGRIDQLPEEEKVDVHRTYGEHCYVGWRHSLCHGWSGGPTAWLSQFVLGISPVCPGYRKVRIDPHWDDLSWARGSVPTPLGTIEVSHIRNNDGTTASEIKLPDGVIIEE